MKAMGEVTLKQIADKIGQDWSNTQKRLANLVNVGLVHKNNTFYNLLEKIATEVT